MRSDTTHQTSVNVDAVPRDERHTFEDLEANFAFGLWSNDFTIPYNMSLIEDYVKFQATIDTFHFDPEKGYIQAAENVALHPCSDEDKFYELLPKLSGTTMVAK